MKKKLQETITNTEERIQTSRARVLKDLMGLSEAIQREIRVMEENPNAMFNTSSVGNLMCLSNTDQIQREVNTMQNLSETLRTLKFLSRQGGSDV